MNIADLFISLKIGNADGAKDTLKTVLASLKEIASSMPDIDLNPNGSQGAVGAIKAITDALKDLDKQKKTTATPEVFGPKERQYDINKPADFIGPKERGYGVEFDKLKELKNPNFAVMKQGLAQARKSIKSLFNVKISDKVQNGFKMLSSGLKSLTTLSFEAKAAIVGALYAFQQLASRSNEAGTNLKNFSALTGISAQTLQQYQYAARQVGVSNEAVESTFESLQSAMAKLSMGQGAPAGFAQFATTMGGITQDDINAFMRNPELLLKKLQEYAQKEKRIGIRNEVLSSFVGKDMAAALAQNAFRPDVLSKAPTYSDREIGNLARVAAIWSNLSESIRKAVGHFNAMHGDKLAAIARTVVDIGLGLADIVVNLVDWNSIFNTLKDGVSWLKSNIKDLKDYLKEGQIYAEGMTKSFLQSETFENLRTLGKSILELFMQIADIFSRLGTSVGLDNFLAALNTAISLLNDAVTGWTQILGFVSDIFGANIFPKEMATAPQTAGGPNLRVVPSSNVPSGNDVTPPMRTENKTTSNSFNVQQTINFSNSGNPRETSEAVKRAVNEAYRQYSAQVQGT